MSIKLLMLTEDKYILIYWFCSNNILSIKTFSKFIFKWNKSYECKQVKAEIIY